MLLKIETQPYNEEDYGEPYIAIIDFEHDKQGHPIWGDWVGTPGYEGLLEIEADEGDIIFKGQKGKRGNNDENIHYQVCNGRLDRIDRGDSKLVLYQTWKASQTQTPLDKLYRQKSLLEDKLILVNAEIKQKKKDCDH